MTRGTEKSTQALLLTEISPDGWGIVEEGDALWLVHPRGRSAIGKPERARCVSQGDFRPTERSFDSWEDLNHHLQSLAISYAKKRSAKSDGDGQ